MVRLRSRWVRVLGVAAVTLSVAAARPLASHATPSLPLVINGKHMLWAPGTPGAPTPNTDPNQAGGNLIYHGGLIFSKPAAYLIYWGPKWKSGFSFKVQDPHPAPNTKPQTFTYTNRTVMNYLNSFFANVGGSPWAGIQTQYCDNVLPGGNCPTSTWPRYVTNPKYQLKGVWVDNSEIPANITTTALAENTTNDPVATEAIKAANHFGYDINAVYFVLTQPGITASAYGSVYCAYHSETSHGPLDHGVRYSFMPYTPDVGCFQNSVNASDNAFGNGYLDGYSLAAGHEYEEAVTDPDNFNSVQDGWNDSKTFETGDKCEGGTLANLNLHGHLYAVQPLWSNEANGGQGGCVMSR